MTARAVFPPGEGREDWKIIRALSDQLGHTLPYDDLAALRAAMYAAVPHLAEIGAVRSAAPDTVSELGRSVGALSSEPFSAAIDDFYLSNPIARASAVMAELSALRKASPTAEAAE